jgi:hypothetical protein
MDIAQIMFPKYDNQGHKLTTPKMLEKELCQKFGGCTVYDGNGSWINNKGKLYAEPVSIIQTAYKNTAKNKSFIKKLIVKYGKLSSQEAVFLSLNNKAKIINLK